MSTTKMDAIGLVVTDMKVTLDFYRHLGLDFPEGADAEDHVEATLQGGLRVMFDTEEVMRSFDPEWSPGTGRARIALAFRCSSPADVNAKYEELTSLGYDGHKPPWDAFWGQRYAQLRDPDGIGVDLFAPI